MSYPDPCLACIKNINGSCQLYKRCPEWITRYRYRQRQINAYAEKVLPAYYAKKKNGSVSE